MKLNFFNSLSKRKQNFVVRSSKVGVYVCGITPDAPTHVGHAFVFTFFDVFLRYLKYLGYKTTYVQNLTNIDDDILKRAKEHGKNWRMFGKKYTRMFLEDMKWLNNRKPDVYPKATDHIKDMIRIIQKLLKRGMVYEKNGSVYFAVKKDKDYGKLSRLSKRTMLKIANERGNNPDDPNKKNPLDFVLWQAKKPGEPSWPSPWGNGRPGWHIECSAMAMKYLGKTIDIQGGGADLMFPHHESSIAQSELATGKQYVRYWMHVGMVYYNGEKMSKSLGNVVLVRDLKKKYNLNTIRIFLLSHHYRSAFEFREKDIQKAKKISELFCKAWRVKVVGESLDVSLWKKKFYSAMNDDVNTQKAIKVLEDLSKEMVKKNQRKNMKDAKAFLAAAFTIFGLQI